jgi:hypothetical protein
MTKMTVWILYAIMVLLMMIDGGSCTWTLNFPFSFFGVFFVLPSNILGFSWV